MNWKRLCAMVPDIVYPVRPGDKNDELRFSLRCLEANYPNHGQVWIVGSKPSWLINVQFIKGNEGKTEAANVYHNILKAVVNTDVSTQLVLMNDDFFITQPVDEIPVLYRGTLKAHLKLNSVARAPNNRWAQSLRTTQLMLQTLGFLTPISYELHVPMPVDRELMAETLGRFTHITPDIPPQWRSLYGNINHIGGQEAPDCKAYGGREISKPFHSTNDASWRHYIRTFTNAYPQPSRYEKRD